MKRTCLAFAIALVPAVGTAQEFTRFPGLSPQQQHLQEPIRTPPPAPAPSPPVPMIQPPPSVQSTNPQVTQFPGSGNMGSPIDRSDRKVPRGLKPGTQDRSKPPPTELTAPPSELMERPPPPANRISTPQPPPLAVPPPAATAPARAPAALPPATTSLPPAAPTVPSAAPPARTGRAPVQSRPATVTTAPSPPQHAPPLANQTPSHWQTVTLPPAPDFSRSNEPVRAAPRSEGARLEGPGMSENAVRALIEADGYRGVSGLTRGADGAWRGRALRGSTEISVGVDANGRVSAE